MLVELGQFDSRVIGLEDLSVAKTLPGETVSSDLAHADPMTPPATGENKTRDAPVRIVLAIDNEELFAQSQCRSDPSTTDVSYTLGRQ